METISIIGAGFAGCEAAWYLANHGVHVKLYEMKPKQFSPAHKSEHFCELVCSNSFKAKRLASAAGLLKAEMKALGSLCVACAEQTAVPAGGALAVDRDKFAAKVSEKIKSHPHIEIICEQLSDFPEGTVIVATGPLTAGELAAKISARCGAPLSFYDAAAPIVDAESVDRNFAFTQSRYDRGGEDDYLNCPLNKEEYERFHEALISAEGAVVHDFDVYEGCMPIEVLASRGMDTMRFGPLKPVGLTDPRTGHRPWAVVQLRRENQEGTMYNLVGFQTNLKFPEQKRVFSMIPGLEHAEFHRYGVMHRNSFLDSPRLLDADYHFRGQDGLYFAGQMTGVEGYMESAASGILAGKNLARQLQGKPPLILPRETMMGALAAYISSAPTENFQPMGANMGILPDLPERIRGKQEKYQAYADRGMAALEQYLQTAEQ